MARFGTAGHAGLRDRAEPSRRRVRNHYTHSSMKILSVSDLPLPGVQVIRFARFRDQRGFFTEPFRRSDIDALDEPADLRGQPFVQANESWSQRDVVRGLHFQWNPVMGKLVRTLHGHMVDIVLDIRKGSPTAGKAILYDMPWDAGADSSEWIWVPPGFAHGNFFPSEAHIEYFCTGEYSPGCEAAISPLAPDIDWSLSEPALKARFDATSAAAIISDKDRQAMTLSEWMADPRSDQFRYSNRDRL
jgi:dTDP-4-dehydrorhamnose 3,5-epimerase